MFGGGAAVRKDGRTEVGPSAEQDDGGAAHRCGRLSLALSVPVAVVFFLQLVSQILVTPPGEGMDWHGHLSHVVFSASRGRSPGTDELSTPVWMPAVTEVLPGPDHSRDGARYRDRGAQQERAQALRRLFDAPAPAADPPADVNYESQQPPLYYAMAGRLWSLLPRVTPLRARIRAVEVLSALLAALAFPGLYGLLRRHFSVTVSAWLLLGLAWYPNLVPFLGRVTNDALAFPAVGWTLCLAFQARDGGPRWRAWAAGAAFGLACFAKAYALVLLPVLVLMAVTAPRGSGRANARVVALVAAAGAALLLARNMALTGHPVPLFHLREMAGVPIGRRLGAVLEVDPLMFAAGVFRGFWWCGYWSFVSPGWFYFAPAVAAAAGLAICAFTRGRGGRFSFRELWPYYLAFAGFLGAQYAHAAAFRLYIAAHGLDRTPGYEGWYLNVLLGAAFVVAGVLLRDRVAPARLLRWTSGTAVFLAAWNLVARAAMRMFWNGAAGLHGLNRNMGVAELWRAWHEDGMAILSRLPPGTDAAGDAAARALLLAALALTAVLAIRLRGEERRIRGAGP